MEGNSTVLTVEHPTIPKNFWNIMKKNIKACLNLDADSVRKASITTVTSQRMRRDALVASGTEEGHLTISQAHETPVTFIELKLYFTRTF